MRKSLIFVLVILMALCGGGVTYAQSDSESGKTENLLFVNDGYIELSGTMPVPRALTICTARQPINSLYFSGSNTDTESYNTHRA